MVSAMLVVWFLMDLMGVMIIKVNPIDVQSSFLHTWQFTVTVTPKKTPIDVQSLDFYESYC
jgi:hypothetical protein